MVSQRGVDGSGPISRRWLGGALALIVAAAVFSVSDVTRCVCDPGNHFDQGHAVWHVLSAASLWPMCLFHRGLGRTGLAAPA